MFSAGLQWIWFFVVLRVLTTPVLLSQTVYFAQCSLKVVNLDPAYRNINAKCVCVVKF